MTWRGCALVFVLGLAVVGDAPGPTRAQQEAGEYEIKAAYIRRFGDFVTWPDGFSPGGPQKFVIGVLGKDPFGRPVLDRLTQLGVNGMGIVVQRFETLADYQPCHVVFLAAEPIGDEQGMTVRERLAALRKRVTGTPTLLVADSEGLGRKGAMINFYLEEKRARLEINPGAAKEAGLVINANLLNLGKIVSTDKD